MAGALGDVLGAASNAFGSMAQYQASKQVANQSWRRQKYWEMLQPSLRVEGLRRAGLNPILAVTQGMTGGPGNIAGARPQAPHFDTGIGSRAVASAKQMALMDSEIDIRRSQAQQEREKARQEVKNTEILEKYGLGLAGADYSIKNESILNLIAQRGLTGAETGSVEQAKMRTQVDRLLMEMGIPGARAMEKLYEEHPWLRQIREFGGGSALGLGAAGAGAGAVGAAQWLKDRKGEPSKGFGESVPGKRKRRK